MTERLYYRDASTTQFEATVVDQIEEAGETAVILDRTFFYPTSGGQPHDTGALNHTAVTRVTLRPEDDTILHWLDTPLQETAVTGQIDWPRRFDHMQQHTGQHILSQAFLQIAAAATESFHLSDATVTIDLAGNNLSDAQVRAAETLANQIVWENRPIHIRSVTPTEAEQFALRKAPPPRNGRLRLIDIDRFDVTACGGTHVTRTGAVGLIKIIKLENRGDQLRVEFRCGQRALDDYRQKHETIGGLTAVLTTGIDELTPSVTRLQADLKEAQRTLKKQQTALLAVKAADLYQRGEQIGPVTLITHVFDGRSPTGLDGRDLRTLSNHLIQHNQTVALLGLAADGKCQLLFARADDAPAHMRDLLQITLPRLNASGGGAPNFAQGGGPAADPQTIANAIAQAAQRLREQLDN